MGHPDLFNDSFSFFLIKQCNFFILATIAQWMLLLFK